MGYRYYKKKRDYRVCKKLQKLLELTFQRFSKYYTDMTSKLIYYKDYRKLQELQRLWRKSIITDNCRNDYRDFTEKYNNYKRLQFKDSENITEVTQRFRDYRDEYKPQITVIHGKIRLFGLLH